MTEQVTTTTTPKKPPSPPSVRADIPTSVWPKDPVAFLLHKGWSPLGDPYHPDTNWLDPTKPDRDIEERRKIGEKILPNKAREEVFQIFVTPRAFPLALKDAVQEQLIRDRAKSGS